MHCEIFKSTYFEEHLRTAALAMYKTRNRGRGNGMRGMLYCGECPQTFREMLPNIAENVAKHSEEFLKHSRECC